MIIMSVDYGDVRTGVAVCDKNEILASPVTVITEKDADVLIEKIMYLANERNVQMFVVGLPKNMDTVQKNWYWGILKTWMAQKVSELRHAESFQKSSQKNQEFLQSFMTKDLQQSLRTMH